MNRYFRVVLSPIIIYRCWVLLGFALFSATPGYTQGPSFEWVVRAGAAATFSAGYGIGYDATGNVYVTGRFNGTADFDPGAGIVNLTSAGALDTYIIKLDAGGNLVWARSVGGTLDDYSFDLFVDNGENVYVTGSFVGTADFDPGAGTFSLSSSGSFEDIFVLKIDTNGNLAWARRMGSSDFDFGRSITVSAAGNVYTTGSFRGTVDFDPGTGTSFLTSAAGQNDVFISKLDASGNFVWAKRLGGTSSDIGYSVTVDDAENVFTTGSFSTTADFDPGASVFNLTAVNSGDIFISKLDAAGSFVWAKGMGGTSSDVGYGVQVDAGGNVYTSGYFETTVDFDPGSGTANLISVGFNDAFICKLDVNGNYLWAKGMGGTSDEESSGLAIDEYGNVYATGSFESTVDFDPGPGIFNLTPGGADGFVLKLDYSGDFVWAQAFDGSGGTRPEAIDVNVNGSIYTTGYFGGTVDFDIGAGVSNVTAAGSNDTYIHKMSQVSTPPTITSFTPSSGPVGTTVIITGTNFSLIPNNNTLQFNGTTATVTASTTTSITCTVPSGTTTGKITVTVSGNTVTSTSDFTVSGNAITITQQPVNPNNRCEGLNFTFSTDATGTTNITYQWQKFNTVSSLFENISNGGNYSGTNTKNLLISNVQLAQAGDYRCMIQGDFTSTVYCNTGTLTVNPVPSAPTVTNGTKCGPGQVVVTASGAADGEYIWYNDTGGTEPIVNENNSTYLTPSISTTTVYSVSIVNSFCESALVQVNAIINNVTPPTTIDGLSCGAGAITLTANGGTAGNYRWYTTASGGTAIAGEVNSTYVTPTVSATTPYYVSVINNGCESSRATVNAVLTTTPTAPTVVGGAQCANGTVILSASGGTNGQYRWYTVASGGTAITGEINSTYTTTALTNTTTYYVSINNGACEGARTAVVATINALPTAPTTTGATACPSTSITLTAAGGTNGQYRWYTVASGGTAISGQVNNTFTIATLTTTTTYYVSVDNGTCESTRTSVTATIQPCSINQPPSITPVTVEAPIDGTVSTSLLALLSDPDNNLDLSTLKIIVPPSSGAKASIDAQQNLILDYSNISFSGTEKLTIEVCDLLGACVQKEIVIEVAGDIIVYNAVSPNNDGKNDIFYIQYISSFEATKINHVYIYNRWGDLVWDTENYDNTNQVFTGLSSDDKELPSGIYYYKLSFSDYSKTGFLNLKR